MYLSTWELITLTPESACEIYDRAGVLYENIYNLLQVQIFHSAVNNISLYSGTLHVML